MQLVGSINIEELSGSEVKKVKLKKEILRLLYHSEIISTPELCRITGMSSPTITGLLNELVALGYVADKGQGSSNGGRKPNLYGLEPDAVYVFAVHSDIYSSALAIYNFRNEVVAGPVTINVELDNEALIDEIYRRYKEMLQASAVDEKKVVGIGMDMPGLIDAESGINHTYSVNGNPHYMQMLSERFALPVFIENDARMQAYGEYVFGKAKGFRNAIIINVKWGIGLGMILDGKLYSGHKGFAGEFSHIQMEDEGQLCSCGKRGCLQTLASVSNLIANAKQGISENKISQLTEKFSASPELLQPIDIVTAAKTGDMFAIQLLSKLGFTLGKGISILIQLLNPEIIIIGGPIASARQYIMAPIQQAINRYCLEKISSNAKIEISEIDEHNAGLSGTTAMVFEKLLNENY